MAIQSDAEEGDNVVVGGTSRSALYYDDDTLEWRQKNQAGVNAPLVNGVASFAGRTGIVVPLQADYDGSFLTPAEGDAAYVAGAGVVTDDLPVIFSGTTGRGIKQKTYAAFKTLLVLVKGDVGLGSVDNTSDVAKPVSTATQTALNLKADLASPTFTGDPRAPTPSQGDNDTSLATTAFVATAVAAGTVGLLDYRGSYDASTNLFPATGGSGVAGAVLKGDFWLCSVTGTLGGTVVTPGDFIIALVDTPAQITANWNLISHDLGYVPVPPSRSVGTTAPLTGGGDLSANRTLAISAATSGAAGSQAAADKARQDNQALGRVNILDFGGDRTGATSSATALTNAQAALPNGGIIEFPPGTYQFGNVNYNLSTAHITLQGTARYGTVFTTTNTAAPIITRNQYYQTIQDITFTGTGSAQNPTGTAGQTLLACNAANSAYGVIRRVTCTYGHTMIDISDTLSVVDDVECRFFKADGILVNQNSDHKIEDATMDNNTSFLPTGGGIHVKLTASLLMNSNNIIHANKALWIDAATGVTIPSVKGVNNFLDNSAYGLCCDGDGSFLRSEFTNTWFSSMATAGIALTPTAGGQADGITFVNCDIYNNVVGTTNGILTNAQTKKWKAVGCSIAGWTTGVNLVAGANHYATLVGNTIGAVAAFGVNTTGVLIGSGAFLGIMLSNNDGVNNTTPITITATPTFADYKQFRIINNPGINVGGAQTPPVASPPAVATTYTNTFGYPIMLNMKMSSTANTSVTINGVANAMGFAAGQVVSWRLEPGDTFAYAGTTTAALWYWNRQ